MTPNTEKTPTSPQSHRFENSLPTPRWLEGTLLGIEQKDAFTESLLQCEEQELFGGYKINVSTRPYSPSLFKKWFFSHEEGLSFDVSISNGNHQILIHSVKVWNSGFDTHYRIGALHHKRRIKGHFPYHPRYDVDVADDIELLPTLLVRACTRKALSLTRFNGTNESPSSL